MNRTKLAITFYITGFLLLAGSVIAGCSLDRILPVGVPPGVQSELGLEKSYTTLREAPRVKERYLLAVTQNVQIFDENASDMAIIHSLASSGITFGAQAGATALDGLGGGGLLGMGVLTVAGLFTKRPRDKSPEQVQIERDLAYDQGAADTKRTMQEQLQLLGLRLTERAGNAVIEKVAEKVADKVVP